jgi:hypothetical protein
MMTNAAVGAALTALCVIGTLGRAPARIQKNPALPAYRFYAGVRGINGST